VSAIVDEDGWQKRERSDGRNQKSLRRTPSEAARKLAMQAGITDHVWSLEEVIALL
jgi:hypothetical protein